MDRSQNSISVFDKHAKLYADKFMNVDLYGETLDAFCEAIKKDNPEILEVACGPGNITKYLLNKRPDFKLLGTDLAPNMLEIAKSNNPTVEFQLMDARDITKLEKKFDAIMCGFCFPYFTKEETLKFIADASAILKTRGVFYISTMEDDYSKSGIRKSSQGDEIFMNFHQADYLTDALLQNNFTVLKTERIASVMTDNTKVIDLVLIAEKK
ncbi:MAG: class I SAM-dependent methyltransferase [Bacteroidota bacterium]